MAKKRVALLGIYHETNTFIESATTLADFKRNFWLEGDVIRTIYEGAHHEISGVIEEIDRHPDLELVPVLYVSATPGGLVERSAYEFILQEMMAALDRVLPIAGCIVVPHGAGAADGYPDLDGHWLSVLRKKLGADVFITGTLDPHANVSPAMIAATDALVPYATNPHIDQKETGRKAARWMVDILRGNLVLRQHLVQLPLAISIEKQYTSQEPCRSLYAFAEEVKEKNGLLSVGILLGFPYADVAEMGSSFIIVVDGKAGHDSAELDKSHADLYRHIMIRKEEFDGKRKTIESLLPSLERLAKPILMLDMGDNVGGGAPGNSIYLLEMLELKGIENVFICLHDPGAVAVASCYQADDEFELLLSEALKKTKLRVKLLQLSDGKFAEGTPRHGGYTSYDMGQTAIVQTAKKYTIMITTHRTPPYSLGQLTAFGLNPASFDIIIAKGVNAPIAAYREVCPTIMQVDTPGVTQANMTLFDYKNRREPMFPFEK